MFVCEVTHNSTDYHCALTAKPVMKIDHVAVNFHFSSSFLDMQVFAECFSRGSEEKNSFEKALMD